MSDLVALHIVENAGWDWHYHLSKTGKSGRSALCGNNKVMSTQLSLGSWGTKSHLGEAYCKKCSRLYKKMQEGK